MASSTTGHPEGVVGCEDPWENETPSRNHISTCVDDVNSFPNAPYAQFIFFLNEDEPFSFDNVQVGFQSHDFDYGSDTCETNEPLGDKHYCEFGVIPEPATVVLLATGLAVLGGTQFIRRRRKGYQIVTD